MSTFTFTLIRWGLRVNIKGALGRRLFRLYVDETRRIERVKQLAANDWGSYR
jgi:hypothetical protein